MKFQYNNETHEYFLGSRKLPGVTDVLKSAGIIDDTWYTEVGCSRGKEVHELTDRFDYEMVELSDVPEDYLGFLQGYARFKSDLGDRLVILESEKPTHHPTFLYAGTPDRVVSIDGFNFLIDIKTGAKSKWHKMQLAAYLAMLKLRYNIYGAYILTLKKNGKYSFERIEMNIERELNVFLACLSVYNWKIENLKKG